MNNEFKKGDYVVLLASCDGGNCWRKIIPINHVYKLRKDSNTYNFYIQKDFKGSTTNGWDLEEGSRDSYKFNKLLLRAATPSEIVRYDLNNGPVPSDYMSEIEEDYSYLKKLLEECLKKRKGG